jgi:hypothetical protein
MPGEDMISVQWGSKRCSPPSKGCCTHWGLHALAYTSGINSAW